MKKWRNKLLSAVLVLSLLLTSSSFAFAVGENDDLKYVKISGITAIGGSSEMNPPDGNEGGFDWAFDGDLVKFWHTNWRNNSDPNGYIIFDLGRKVNISRLEFMPRQDNSTNGRIGQYEISVSSSFDAGMTKDSLEDTWSVAATGTWDWTNYEAGTVKNADLTNVFARYVKLKAITTTANHVCAAEIYCYENTVDPVITVQPESIFSSSEVQLSVNAEPSLSGAELTYQWFSYKAGQTAEDAQVVVDGTSNTINVTPTSESKFYYVVVTQTNGDIIGTVTSDVAEVNTGSTEYQITKSSGLSVLGCSSFEESAPPSNAIDGTTTTMWHSNYNTGTDGNGFDRERYISFDLGKEYYLSKVRYLPRQAGGTNGMFKDCDVYVSSDGVEWILLYSASGWADNLEWKEISVEIPIKTQYVKVVGVNTYTNSTEGSAAVNKFATAAEIEFYADTTAEIADMITSQPQGGAIASTGSEALVLNVGAKEGSSYQWYSNDENSYIGATAILGATQASYTPADETKYYFVKVDNGSKNCYSDIVLVNSTEAKIGENKYSTLTEAINAAQSGDVVEVLKNVDLTSGITLNKNITIKSAEEKVTIKRGVGNTGDLFIIGSTGELTLENVIVDGGTVWANEHPASADQNSTQGTYIKAGALIKLDASGSKFTLGEEAILQNNYNEKSSGGAIQCDAKSTNDSRTIIIKGTIQNCATFNGSYSNGGAIASAGNLTIETTANLLYNYAWNKESGGGAIQLFRDYSRATISGGTFIGNSTALRGGVIYMGGGVLDINGGTFTENTAAMDGGVIYVDGGTTNLNGGTFTNNTGNNGGAVSVNKGTLNVGQTGNDFAITISGNTAANGSGIYYGGNSSTVLNINAKFEMDDKLYLHTNGRTFNVNCDLTGNAPIDVITTRPLTDIATMNTQENAQGALNVIKYTYNNNRVATKLNNLIMTRNESSGLQISKDINTSTLYYKGVENNLYTVAGANTYTWYEKVEGSNKFAVVADGLDSLSNGEHTVYCVATDGTNYMVSDVATITVKDFYPCSKAIAKFKSI